MIVAQELFTPNSSSLDAARRSAPTVLIR